MRSFWTFSALTWVLSLAQCVNAANFQSHVFERVWLWEMYDVFCDAAKGADKQGYIFKQLKKGFKDFLNVGDADSKGRLSYAQFQYRLNGGGFNLETGSQVAKIPTDLVDPRNSGIEAAANSLLAKGYNKNLIIEQIDGTNKKPPKSQADQRYVKLIDNIEAQFSQFRLNPDPEVQAAFNDARMTRLRGLGNAIVQLRKEDTQAWIVRDIEKKCGIKLTQEQAPKTSSVVPGMKDYQKVDIAKIIQDYREPNGKFKEPLSKAFESADKFMAWMDTQTNHSGDLSGVDDSSKSHFRSLQSWQSFEKRVNMNLADLRRECSR